jgi:Polyketide cyclase / dehydrase and lipid transport
MSGASTAVISGKRGHVAIIEAEADIRRSPEEVFAYCSDPLREPEWNPRMRHIEQIGDGPVGVGARYKMEFIPGRPMIAACVRFDRPMAWALVGEMLSMQFGLGGRVLATNYGAHLVLQMEFLAPRLLGLALPLLRRRMRPELTRDIATIKAQLEG